MAPARPRSAAGPVEVFYDPVYCGAGHDFDTTRKAAHLAADLAARPVPGVVVRAPEPAAPADLERIHDQRYIDAVVHGTPEGLARSSGLGWDPGHAAAVLASTGGCIAAARSAWRRGVAGSLSSGLHHARRAGGSGYCTVNGLALAALTLADLGAERVLVLDLDAHCGGGTADILGHHPAATSMDVTSIDVATSSFDRYEPPEGWSLDVVQDADRYLATVEDRLAAVAPGSVDAVVYNAGMDPHEDCSTGGLTGITDDVLASREALVFDFAAVHGVPVAFVLAGGYTSAALDAEHLTALHRLTVEAAAGAAHTGEVAA